MEETDKINRLIEHLFRHQSGQMVSVLTRIFGSENLDLAEDVVHDALIEAIKLWTFNGVPDNPAAWLYSVAKNKALNIVNREKYKRRYLSDVAHFLQSEWTAEPALTHLFSGEEIMDDQLRMMFICCYPSLSPDSQVALILKTLCGFSISEIARAFLTSEENIKKRLVRARQKIRNEKIPFEVPKGDDLEKRLGAVLEAIYLLFNEGYNASTGTDLIRFEVCEEAIRLVEIISHHAMIHDRGIVYALLALMQLNACRFKSRQDHDGNIVTLDKQDRSLWDYDLMQKGFANLERSSAGSLISVYHILAAISAYHCSAREYGATDWKGILILYDRLLQIDNSPIVVLNRAIAVSKVCGAEEAILELERIESLASLKTYYLFYSIQGEFYAELKQFSKAALSFKVAIELAPMHAEKALLNKKLENCLQKF